MKMYEYNKKQQLEKQNAARQGIRRIGRGVGAILQRPAKALVVCAVWAVLLALGTVCRIHMEGQVYGPPDALKDFLVGFILTPFGGAVTIALAWAWGGPLDAGKVQDDLTRAGIVNSAGEPPTLISRTNAPNNPNLKVWEFQSTGLSVPYFMDRADALQSALNVTVAEIRQGRDNQHIQVFAAPPSSALPTLLVWNNTCKPVDNSTLVLGKSLIGDVTVNLAKVPHLLIGGSTGSGKTILLKNLLRQCIGIWGKVYIIDFKGGVDFGLWWEERCKIGTTPDELSEILDQFSKALEERRMILRNAGCSNIDEYNATGSGPSLRRMIFACDEVATFLDRNGLDKTQKETVARVERTLSLIAQQGRAFGLHLFLSTQRPDASLITGQIRSNIDFRICGRADDILSQIIVGSTAANDLIPKTSQGRFVVNQSDGTAETVFQAFAHPSDINTQVPPGRVQYTI